ncbi:hypothetical protein PVAND_014299 [Polypedilum vanderplanki]|uniref:Uncharacterized protein n=1 Tax=Polypedilum vanderplanki TaxID=319348 RepID=A0A9J6B8R5_POLVA|nr:hypothetical protein PVAND_017600 [Polypedilum vanderplanki]KAG5685098.1 hypothetical protein PVAND_014299 [Polypedilum vanderplanki]
MISDKTEVMTKNSEARETKWSYYYMGLWTWHLPLWFLLYFVFYLVFCTIRSIYKHKFLDADEYGRSVVMDDNYMNNLTYFVLNGIEKFENKFLSDYEYF